MADGPVIHVIQVRALTLRRTQTEGCRIVFGERYRWSCDDIGRYDTMRQAVVRRLATSDDRAIVRGVAGRRVTSRQPRAAANHEQRTKDSPTGVQLPTTLPSTASRSCCQLRRRRRADVGEYSATLHTSLHDTRTHRTSATYSDVVAEQLP